jgi:hypothetical protein
VATAAAAAFAACDKNNDENGGGTPAPAGSMTLGGITWASVHVDEFQTFAAKPDIYTKLYQWGSSKAWAATGEVTGWDSSSAPLLRGRLPPAPKGGGCPRWRSTGRWTAQAARGLMPTRGATPWRVASTSLFAACDNCCSVAAAVLLLSGICNAA